MKSSLHNIKVYKEKLFSTRQEKGLKRLRRLYRYKLGLLNKKYIDISGNLKDFQLKVFIRVRPNNVFCTLKNLNSGKILINRSSGIYNLQISKKKLKYNIKMMLQFFFKDIEIFYKREKNILIEVICGVKVRKQIIKFLKQKIRKKNIVLQLNEKRCFNGCKPPKKKRKKRMGLRIFK